MRWCCFFRYRCSRCQRWWCLGLGRWRQPKAAENRWGRPDLWLCARVCWSELTPQLSLSAITSYSRRFIFFNNCYSRLRPQVSTATSRRTATAYQIACTAVAPPPPNTLFVIGDVTCIIITIMIGVMATLFYFLICRICRRRPFVDSIW